MWNSPHWFLGINSCLTALRTHDIAFDNSKGGWSQEKSQPDLFNSTQPRNHNKRISTTEGICCKTGTIVWILQVLTSYRFLVCLVWVKSCKNWLAKQTKGNAAIIRDKNTLAKQRKQHCHYNFLFVDCTIHTRAFLEPVLGRLSTVLKTNLR